MVKAADCKSVTWKHCRFKSYSAHLIWSHKPNLVRQRFAKPRVTAVLWCLSSSLGVAVNLGNKKAQSRTVIFGFGDRRSAFELLSYNLLPLKESNSGMNLFMQLTASKTSTCLQVQCP